MSKQCAKCTKTVFPVEELKCLDKVWHKGCFRCQVCEMTLNMKNYKGYNKLPYCNAHYPKTTHTVVADTPETRRIAENTKIQSNIQYHKDFEMSKDQFTPVVDTPDLKRVRDNTKNISLVEYQKEFTTQRGTCNQICDTVEMRTHFRNTDNFSTIKYHAEFEKSKGAKISIADDPETKRVRKNMETISNISYHGDIHKRNQMEMNRPVEQEANQGQGRRRPGSTGDYDPRGRQPGSISDYDPTANQMGTPYSQRQSQGTAVYDSRTGVVYENPMAYQGGNPQYPGSGAPQQQGGNAPAYTVWQPSSARVVQNGSHGRKVGSISDYDPVNEKYGSIAGQYSGHQQPQQLPPPPQQEDPIPQYNPVEVLPGKLVYSNSHFKLEEDPITNTPSVTMDEEIPTTTTPSITTDEEQVSTTPTVPPVPEDSVDTEKDAISAQEEDPKMEIHFATPVMMTKTPTNLPMYTSPPTVDNDIPPAYDPPPPPTEDSFTPSDDFKLPASSDNVTGSSQPQQARQPAYQPPQQQQQQPYRPPGQPQRNQVKYVALYDYTAADDDEVSFREEDFIINCEIIDPGWMEGTVERTGQRGMLPSNYVEKTSS
ncbi:LIM and SH3 domain protein F42H10.3-like [Ylistrum balloti]|uniref:LIM and SH3 domain protein F42H10.3-like n=1 Tax=Ylistrum balloti TaxID=509963 RepID=UPI00290599BA|nr:LIM and SH3 domain protein F42H10.3-like [Ylistrum balloti]